MVDNRHHPGDSGQCYLAHVNTQVIVLNGASSSGKTSIARCLQAMLTTPWLLLGIDDLIRAMPDRGIEDGTLLHIGATGQVEVGPEWRNLEASWYIGIAAIAASGTGVIVDEVFLDGGGSQERLRTVFGGLEVLWVGVKCDREVASAREALRPDRVAGMTESQAAVVHEGVMYDLIVDTSHASSESCAARVLAKASTMA
jgi:chloramphenicol 3-O phosphotransferase